MKREIRNMIKEMVDYELENMDEDVIYSLAEDTLYQWYDKQTENHIKNLYENRVYKDEDQQL